MTTALWKTIGDGQWVGSDPSERLPVYTRGNAGEVYPKVFTPLSFSMASEASEQAMRSALLKSGFLRQSELDRLPLSTAIGSGVFGGYAYLNLSVQRLIAARVPGGKATDADVNLLGVGDAPVHVPIEGERSMRGSLAGMRYILSLLRTPDLAHLDDDQKRVDAYLASLPDVATASNDELHLATNDLIDTFSDLFRIHLEISFAAGIMLSVLSNLCETKLDDAELAVRLLAGLGDVDSAAPSVALWDLGRLVAIDPELNRRFETCTGARELGQLWTDLQSESADSPFVVAFNDFIKEFGARGPNEWDTAFDTWETDPSLAVTLVDRMRNADASHDPTTQRDRLSREQQALAASSRTKLKQPIRAIFDRALRSARAYSQGRERAKTTVVRAIHGARLLSQELDRRLVQQSGGARGDLWFVVKDELDAYLKDPASFAGTISTRREMHHQLSERVPPFFFSGQQPPLDEWELRTAERTDVIAGEVMVGIPGCLGVARGRARVVLDPSDPGALGPGDVLIAPITDPSWTPLFVPAEAVVVDVGAVMSHAVIVSRELGIPCVVSATDATRRIPDGALIEVDGSKGTVTILALPD